MATDSGSTRTTGGFKEALQYVSKGWIPIQTDTFADFTKKLSSGMYDGDRSRLLQDLKSDIGLYTWSFKRLGEIAERQERSKHPAKILRNLESAKLRDLFTLPSDFAPTHRLDQADAYQKGRLRHAAISCSASELLAEKTDFDAEVVYSCAMLRQFGFIAAAWNYPRTFSKALTSVASTNNNLELALRKYLGFSPTLLGLSLTIDWNSCPSLLLGVDYLSLEGADTKKSDVSSWDEELKYTGENIAGFCEVGEALARASDPKHYAVSAREWDRVVGKINHYLGPRGLQLISERIADNFGSSPIILGEQKIIEFIAPKEGSGLSALGKKLFQENVHIRKCTPPVQQKFTEIYELIEGGSMSIEALNRLVGDVIPAAGFRRGCIYMAEANNTMMVPKVRIGEASLDRFKSMRCSNASPFSHPVLEALSCSVPIKQDNVLMYGELVSHVTGVFGTREKVGVLYLELAGDLAKEDSVKALNYFKAVRQCLNDCLNLREQAGNMPLTVRSN